MDAVAHAARETDRMEIRDTIDEKLLHEVRKGKHAMVWVQGETAFTRHMPFWREAIHVFTPAFERSADMGSLPHADLRFFGIASDLAIDSDILKNQLAQWQPRITHLWRRFDARRIAWHDYAVALSIGEGQLVASSLRFAGGLGQQPSTLDTNPMGAWLLRRFNTGK